MNRFEWVNATSVDQALASVISGSSFKAGGIDLLDLMKDGIAAPPRLVNIRNIDGLNQIAEIAQGLIIGPLVTLTQIEEHPVIQKKYSALAEAASRAATPQIRNMATIGGNLAQRPRCPWRPRCPSPAATAATSRRPCAWPTWACSAGPPRWAAGSAR